MYLTTLPLEQSVGQLLCHNLADEQGRKAFKKGHRIAEADLPALRALGHEELRVAVLEPGDLHEDEAASRLAAMLAGPNTHPSRATTGRVNLLAAARGLLAIDLAALEAVNAIDGLTIATLPRHQVVDAKTILATIKIIPFAVPASALARAEQALEGRAVLSVRPLRPTQAGIILVGHPSAERRVREAVLPAVEGRLAELGAGALPALYVGLEERAVAEAIGQLRERGAELLIIAGETSVMDIDDVIPAGVVEAGGQIIHHGAPVEPGNLLLLAELPALRADKPPLPVIGAPGCVRSRGTNVVDLILPRLLSGERLYKRDIVALGHGGLLV
jgi:molybdenum cofactor cytidylyltransferase